jgi:hypothetical protein
VPPGAAARVLRLDHYEAYRRGGGGGGGAGGARAASGSFRRRAEGGAAAASTTSGGGGGGGGGSGGPPLAIAPPEKKPPPLSGAALADLEAQWAALGAALHTVVFASFSARVEAGGGGLDPRETHPASPCRRGGCART